eukprot:scaffold12.g8139.t1
MESPHNPMDPVWPLEIAGGDCGELGGRGELAAASRAAVVRAADAAAAAAAALQQCIATQPSSSSSLLLSAAAAATSAAAASASATALLLAQLNGQAPQPAAAASLASATALTSPAAAGASPSKGPSSSEPGLVAIEEGAAQLQAALDALTPGAPAAVSWHAGWSEACAAAARGALSLAAAHPGAAFYLLDVEISAPNTALALEKVMLRPESRRPGAKPGLKSGEKWPCLTLHYAPSLQPAACFCGLQAVERLGEALREHERDAAARGGGPHTNTAADAGTAAGEAPGAAPALEAAAPTADGSSLSQQPVAMTRGAAEIKELLQGAQAAGAPVVVVWTRRAGGAPDGGGGAALAGAAAAEAARGGWRARLALADAGASKANERLAEALGVRSFPTVHAYQDMKLERRLAGADASPAGLAALLADLQGGAPRGAAAGPAAAAEADPAGEGAAGAGAGGGQGAGGAAAAEEEGAGDDPFAPPAGKFARKNAIKRMPDGVMAHFFPKMPCLRCGCPWWSSDEWDARCVRCGWDCEKSGYDDDSQPLPRHAKKWEGFVASIAAGRTPAYTPPRGDA